MIDLTILMPCLNEAETIETCITKALTWGGSSGLRVEVLIADNGSTDGSIDIARNLGARVVDVAERGYGAALYEGCRQAQGRWIVMGDADDSYDFSRLDAFVDALADGADLVMGNRFAGGIADGAMPWKNRYVGNPVLSQIGRSLFGVRVRDFHCGLRAITASAFKQLDLRTTGMEFASEMVIKAARSGMCIAEVPTTLSKDGRSRPPHLRPWRDGWRHLRFMMLLSPRWLFVLPGTAITVVALAMYVRLLFGSWQIGDVTLDLHTLFYAQTAVVLGLLMVMTGIATRTIGTRDGLFPAHPWLQRFSYSPTPELGALAGVGVFLAGLARGLVVFGDWGATGFGPLPLGDFLRSISASTLLLMIGGLVFVFSLLLGFLSLPTRKAQAVDEADSSAEVP